MAADETFLAPIAPQEAYARKHIASGAYKSTCWIRKPDDIWPKGARGCEVRNWLLRDSFSRGR